MNPQTELLKEVIMAISLYKESLETPLIGKTHSQTIDDIYEARQHLFSFLETPQYED